MQNYTKLNSLKLPSVLENINVLKFSLNKKKDYDFSFPLSELLMIYLKQLCSRKVRYTQDTHIWWTAQYCSKTSSTYCWSVNNTTVIIHKSQ